MKFREPGTTSTLIVMAALLVLLPLLAVLQYRWLAQLSEREREHMNLNLRAIATRFSQDFDDEIARAYAFFSLSPELAKAEGLSAYAARYDRWMTVVPYPRLIRDAYVALADERGQLRLSQLKGEGGQYAALEWPQALSTLRIKLQHWTVADARVSIRDLMSSRVRPIDDAGLVLVNPIFSTLPADQRAQPGPAPLSGFVILVLNPIEIEREILPAIAKRHFSGTESFDYSASVLSQLPERRVVYHFGPGVPPGAKGDVSVGLMGLNRESFRRVMASLPPAEAGFFSAPRPPPPARQFGSVRPRRTDASRVPPTEEELKLWELRLTHRAGSLEAAVLSIRRRNLLISFGVLVLLGVSVALMMLSARRAQLLARRQLDFVAGVTHELRTPLSVIKSAAWSLKRGVVKDPQGIQRYSDLIGNESDRLIEMIEQVLEFAGARSLQQKLELQPTSINQLVDEVLAAALPLLSERGFHVERNVPADLPLVMADAPSLSRALRNLVDNAMKFSGERRWIGIGAEVTGNSRKTEVQVTVIDRGNGIRPDEVSHIFEPFWRGSEAMAAQIHGNGLGLNLVKAVIDAHGGRLSVATEPGRGSSFSISIPAAAKADTQRAKIASQQLDTDSAL